MHKFNMILSFEDNVKVKMPIEAGSWFAAYEFAQRFAEHNKLMLHDVEEIEEKK